MFYGPYEAAKFYSTNRFKLVDRFVLETKAGRNMGMHPETFLAKMIFPAIEKNLSIAIVEDSSICFLRARADESLWISDCANARKKGPAPSKDEILLNVIETLDLQCKIKGEHGIMQATCLCQQKNTSQQE
jgi:hypothetical protein